MIQDSIYNECVRERNEWKRRAERAEANLDEADEDVESWMQKQLQKELDRRLWTENSVCPRCKSNNPKICRYRLLPDAPSHIHGSRHGCCNHPWHILKEA